MTMLIAKFGRNAYFERRRGERLLSPKEQVIILAALRQAGVTGEMEFDQYVENVNWYDWVGLYNLSHTIRFKCPHCSKERGNTLFNFY